MWNVEYRSLLDLERMAHLHKGTIMLMLSQERHEQVHLSSSAPIEDLTISSVKGKESWYIIYAKWITRVEHYRAQSGRPLTALHHPQISP